MRWLALAVPCLVLLAAGRGGADPSADPASPGSLRGELQSHTARARAGVQKLAAFKRRYAEAKDEAELDGIGAERAVVRGELDACYRRMAVLTEEFDRLLQKDVVEKGVLVLTQVFKRGRPPYEKGVPWLFDMDQILTDARRAQDAIGEAMEVDDKAWLAAQKEFAFWRRMKKLGGFGLAAAVAGACIGAWRIRRRAPRTVRAVEGRPPVGARPSDPLAPGAVVAGNYRIICELGQGSMGPVYEALDVAKREKIVIKRIREEFHKSEKDLERFLAAARNVASLKHNNLAEIFSVFLANERICLAMEHVPGHSLSRALEGGARLPMRQVKNIISQAAAVLDHAHEQKILHGDLKPSNILLRPDGVVKVSDFGLALLARKFAAKMTWDSAQSTAYMAPEQELGEPGTRSDVYSLGVIFYEMVTGRLPFPGPDFLQQKRAARFAAPGLSWALSAITNTALKLDPKARFPTASDLFAEVVELPDD